MRILILFLILAMTNQVSAETLGFCGRLDFNKVKNSELEQIFSSEDVMNQNSIQRIQCGLPGEKLNICQSCADATSEASMQILRPLLASEGHLNWHFSWHNNRRSQELLAQENSSQKFIQEHLLGGTLSGEDFLYMHRLMIKMTQADLAANGQPCFAPWTDLPDLDDPNWTYPKKLATPEAASKAANDLEVLRKQLGKFRNPVLLKKMSLNRLGQAVESTVHQSLHNFYRGNPVCSPEAKAQGYCDDLIPNETSPLNKHFWKLHGLIDNMIGDWLNANGYNEISKNCEGRPACYQWGDVWVSQYPGAR